MACAWRAHCVQGGANVRVVGYILYTDAIARRLVHSLAIDRCARQVCRLAMDVQLDSWVVLKL
jgi:hypothetical protein